jgi:hypothetical protein
MNLDLLGKALSMLDSFEDQKPASFNKSQLNTGSIKKVKDKAISYTQRHRGNWFRPEYDFDEIQIVQDTDSYVSRSIKKKLDRFITAGFEFVAKNDAPLTYIKQRIAEMEIATNKPFNILMAELAHDIVRYNNCMWAKTRDNLRSSGKIRTDIRGVELEPVAGYHLLPFETLEFKTRPNGELKKLMQSMGDGKKKEFFPADVVHFYTNKKPGFCVGTPDLYTAIDDVALLRRIEENVEDLIETNLFPVYHYRIGSDAFPERYGPNGVKETDIVRKNIEYMPPGGVYISDHRHEIASIGSESKALRIDFYLDYFKSRVFSALGVSPIDMGEGGESNRSTASTLSKGMMMDVEALQAMIAIFINFFVITELLLEGGFNPLDEEDKVEIQFGVVDREERIAFENQQSQLFMNNAITQTELRKALRKRPLTSEDHEDTNYARYTEPLALIKATGATGLGEDVLAGVETSNVTPAAAASSKKIIKENNKKAATAGSNTKTNKSLTNKVQPKNQHGTRSSAKLTSDVALECEDYVHCIEVNYKDEYIKLNVNGDIKQEVVDCWSSMVIERYNDLADYKVSLYAVASNLLPRLYKLNEN